MNYRLNYLEELEAEAIFILREAFAQFTNPVILFSGGKDSIVVTHLAEKAFAPGKNPFKLVHIDTGHNFPETLSFRDELVKKMNLELIIGFVQDSIDSGAVKEESGFDASRNSAQTITLLEVIKTYKIDAAIGGARRDEEKSRAKERIFSHRNSQGQWDPKNQRPELWSIYNGKKNKDEHFRIFPISNWTEADIWNYIYQENISLPSLYFAHERKCFKRGNVILASSDFVTLKPNEKTMLKKIRFRTIGDMTITGAIESEADSLEKVLTEVLGFTTSERFNRADDNRTESSMEERKKDGYF